MRHFQIHCATSRGLLSNILSFEVGAASVAAVLRLESLIFGIALSSTDEVSCVVVVATGEGVRERSELATEQQSGPVDIGSGELGGRSEAVEDLEEAEDGEGFGGDGDVFLG